MTPYSAAEKAGLERAIWFRQKGRGYFAEQSTQPQTLGYALADSPSGLLAWIYEKLVTWTDSYPWTDDDGLFFVRSIYTPTMILILAQVLTWVSIYWFSRAGPAASVRIYYEASQAFNLLGSYVSKVPMGISVFPKDLGIVPRRYELLTFLYMTFLYLANGDCSWMYAIGKVVFMSEHESGGHFAAFEKPDELVQDLHKFLGKGGPAHGVVEGSNGYAVSSRL